MGTTRSAQAHARRGQLSGFRFDEQGARARRRSWPTLRLSTPARRSRAAGVRACRESRARWSEATTQVGSSPRPSCRHGPGGARTVVRGARRTRRERRSPRSCHGRAVAASVRSSMSCRSAMPCGCTTRPTASPRLASAVHPASISSSVFPRERLEPIPLIVEPGVVQDRGLGVGQSRRDDDGPMGVASPFAQAVHRMPAREERGSRAGEGQQRAEQDPSHEGQSVHHRPQGRPHLLEGLDDGRGVGSEPHLDRFVRGRSRTSGSPAARRASRRPCGFRSS